MSLTKEQLLSKRTESARIDVDDGHVMVKPWNGAARAAYVDASLDESHGMTPGVRNEYLNSLIVQLSVADDEGVLLFGPDDLNDIRDSMDGAVIKRIIGKALIINGMTDSAIGDAEKKSEATQSDGSI
jgi:hypothetical protein